MAENNQLRLDVTLDLGSDQITGTIDDGAGPEVDFAGWLELMSAFDTVASRARGGKRRTAAPAAPTGQGRRTRGSED